MEIIQHLERSKDTEILNLMALLALAEEKPSVALHLFKQALQIDPGNIPVRMNMGVLYLRHRQLPEAATQFERILRIMPTNMDAKLHLAIIKNARGETAVAERMYREILSARPGNTLALFNLAVLQKNQGRYSHAMNSLKSYLQSDQARSSDTDEVFALINDIQHLQEEGGTKRISDAEIQSLASDLRKRDSSRTQNPNVNTHNDFVDDTSDGGSDPKRSKTNIEREIDDLERELAR